MTGRMWTESPGTVEAILRGFGELKNCSAVLMPVPVMTMQAWFSVCTDSQPRKLVDVEFRPW